MKLYLEYIINYDNSMDTFRALIKKNRSFRKLVEVCLREHKYPLILVILFTQSIVSPKFPVSGFAYWEFLSITPLQRIPRYALLLKVGVHRSFHNWLMR